MGGLFVDLVMPVMGGLEFGKRLRTLRPRVKIVYMSGYTDTATFESMMLDECTFLQKPFSAEALTRKLREILSGAPAGALA